MSCMSHADSRPGLQLGNDMVAAGYALYSSATMLVLSWGGGVHGFTLDRGLGEFVLSHPAMQIPARGEKLDPQRARAWLASLLCPQESKAGGVI